MDFKKAFLFVILAGSTAIALVSQLGASSSAAKPGLPAQQQVETLQM